MGSTTWWPENEPDVADGTMIWELGRGARYQQQEEEQFDVVLSLYDEPGIVGSKRGGRLVAEAHKYLGMYFCK